MLFAVHIYVMSSNYHIVVGYIVSVFFFFFKQKTAYEMRISDWSSDVCSSDLSNGEHRSRRQLLHYATACGDQSQSIFKRKHPGETRGHVLPETVTEDRKSVV